MIAVTVPCSCPDQTSKGVVVKAAPIHDSDTVWIPDVLDARIGAAGTFAVQVTPAVGADMEGAISAAFLHNAPRAWTFEDETGEPLPVTIENIEARLTWNHGGSEVAEKANELYAGDLFAPLVRRMPKPSRSGRTATSTSPTQRSGSDRAGRSSRKPSLRTVTGGQVSEEKAS